MSKFEAFSRDWSDRFERSLLFSRHILKVMYVLIAFSVCHLVGLSMLDLFGFVKDEQMAASILLTVHMVDTTMVANMAWFMSVGSYYVFVKTTVPELDVPKYKPQSLQHLSSSILKTKMTGSLVGISSVSLVKIFLEIKAPVDWSLLWAKITIHLFLLIGLWVFVDQSQKEEAMKIAEKKAEAGKEIAHAS